jgi:nitroreductase
MYLQTVMLLARERGLHTCAQEAWAAWHLTVTEYLSLPAHLMVFCGLALGHRNEAAPINTLRTDRAPLDEYATFYGFEECRETLQDG